VLWLSVLEVLLLGAVAWCCCLALLLGAVAWRCCLALLLGAVAWRCCLALFHGAVAAWVGGIWVLSVSWLLILSASDYGTAVDAALDSIGAVAVGVVALLLGLLEHLVMSIGWLLDMSVVHVGTVAWRCCCQRFCC
jgi:hypothetical protein